MADVTPPTEAPIDPSFDDLDVIASTVAAPVADTIDPNAQVDVRVDDLIVGRPLQCPIYDAAGVLLLAEGSTITSEFKRLLKQRGNGSVRVNEVDANRVRLVKLEPQDNFAFDTAIAERMDKVIDSGLMFVQNNGPAVKSNTVYHGKKAFDLEKQDSLRMQRAATGESLNSMMKEAVRGRSIDSTVVTKLAATFLTDMTDDSDCALSTALEATREKDLANHCLKMAMLGMAIGVELGLDEENCKKICISGLVHDWGMARIPAAIRNADRVLTEDEFFQIKKHPIYTTEMLERMPGMPSMVPIIAYQVHERPNGRGYPRGRTGERIHLFARILGAADMYVALTEAKPWRSALAPYAAMECLVRMAKTKDVSPDVVRAMLNIMSLFPIGSYVTLNDGSVAQVMRRNGDKYTKPIVQVVQDANGNPVPRNSQEAMIDLADSTVQIVQALPTPGHDETLLTDDIQIPVRPRRSQVTGG